MLATARPPRELLELRDVPHTPIEETLRRGSRLISRKVGLIRSIRRGLHKAQEPTFFSVGSELINQSRSTGMAIPPLCSGGGESLAQALASTLGESVERYCMSYCDKSGTLVAPYREVAEDAVSPDLARLYTQEQVEAAGPDAPLTYFDEETPVRWVWGTSLTEGRARLVPASLVYLRREIEEGEADVGSNPSTGLAAGVTLEEAILSGLLEVIERDAFMISWLQRRVRGEIRVDDGSLTELLDRRFFARHPSVDLRLFDLRLDLPVPTVMAVLRRPTDFGPVLCVTAAARLSAQAAARKALAEQGQLFSFFRYLVRQDWQPEPDFSNIATFDHHSLLYLRRPELIPKALAFCREAPEVLLSQIPDRSTGRVRSDIHFCLDSLQEAGYEAIVVEVTTPDVAEAGFRVVRVVVPGMMPLHGDARRFLAVRRLHDIPVRLGWEDQGWDPGAGLNPYPHPFP
jgi:ribosomal protein S12 methylthiotransferase accessory factor